MYLQSGHMWTVFLWCQGTQRLFYNITNYKTTNRLQTSMCGNREAYLDSGFRCVLCHILAWQRRKGEHFKICRPQRCRFSSSTLVWRTAGGTAQITRAGVTVVPQFLTPGRRPLKGFPDPVFKYKKLLRLKRRISGSANRALFHQKNTRHGCVSQRLQKGIATLGWQNHRGP